MPLASLAACPECGLDVRVGYQGGEPPECQVLLHALVCRSKLANSNLFCLHCWGEKWVGIVDKKIKDKSISNMLEAISALESERGKGRGRG